MATSAQPIALGAAPTAVSGRHLVLTMAAGAFFTAFDASAVNAALPLFRDAFATTIAHIQWVLTADLLVTTALLLVFVRVGDFVGHRRVYVAGFCAVLPGCILCATAASLAA